MDTMFAHMEGLTDTVKKYINNRATAAALSTAAKTSAVVANIIAGIVVAAIILPAVLFLGTTAALALGAWWGKIWLGFLVIGLFFIVVAIVVWVLRQQIIRIPVMNSMIRQMAPDENESATDENN